MNKGYLIFDKSKSTLINNKYKFAFPRGIKLQKYRLKDFYLSGLESFVNVGQNKNYDSLVKAYADYNNDKNITFFIEGVTMTWYTPKIHEVSVGLEINSYACAEV